MGPVDTICVLISDIVPFIFTVSAFAYGVKSFFKKGKAFYLQLITLAMGCYAMGSFYHICQSLTDDRIAEGFTAAYLGKMGFFLFLFTANYGQIDGLVDDRTPKMKKFRYIALLAPLALIALFIPCAVTDMPLATKISTGLVWLCALPSSYFNFKHAIMSDEGFGFIKAIRPYNISVLILTVIELLLLLLWAYYDLPYALIVLAVISIVFGVMGIVTMTKLKKGVEAWIT